MKLIKPTMDLKSAYLEMVNEWVLAKEKLVPFSLEYDTSDFKKFIEMNQLAEIVAAEGFVCHSTFWLLNDKHTIVGTSNIRHSLTDKLLIQNGHIGYGIRPSQRKKGFATNILELSLREAKRLGIKKALLTCDKDNIGSKKVIQKNGGQFRREEIVEGKLSLSFWIDIK